MLLTAAVALGLAAAVPAVALAGAPVAAGNGGMCGPLAPPAGGLPCGPGDEIRFGRGESSWLSGGWIYDETLVWYFTADRGQLLQLNIAATDRNVAAHVFAPDGNELLAWGTDDWGYQDVVLPANGRYAIVLDSYGDSIYGISMGIDSISPVTMGYFGRIQVGLDPDNATVSNSVLSADFDLWVFDAEAGQDASVYLGSVEANAVFEFVDPFGGQLATEAEEWHGTLLDAGSYVLIVSPTARNATYELTLVLPGGTTDAGPVGPVGQVVDGREVSEHTGGKQIRFEPGTNNGVISGSLAAGTGDGWEFRASAGQRLIVDLLGDFVIVEVYTADGQALLTRGEHNAQAVADLPVSGTYYLYVWAPADASADFELRLTIP